MNKNKKKIIYRFKTAGILELNIIFKQATTNNILEEVDLETLDQILEMVTELPEQEILDILLYNQKVEKIQKAIDAILKYAKFNQ